MGNETSNVIQQYLLKQKLYTFFLNNRFSVHGHFNVFTALVGTNRRDKLLEHKLILRGSKQTNDDEAVIAMYLFHPCFSIETRCLRVSVYVFIF